MTVALQLFVLEGIGEIVAGDDLVELIAVAAGVATDAAAGAATDAGGLLLHDGDILAVTSKIVSKAEGRAVAADDREQAITDETVRVVASRAHAGGVTRIVENRQGLVLAAAGVDSSNTPDGTVLLLPVDPDASALALCAGLRERTGLQLGVIITDTAGRPWREGQTDIAIGAAGVAVLDDLRGTTDAGGRRLDVTVAALADEVAAAADLVKGKTSGNPVAVVRGLGRFVGELVGWPAELDSPGELDSQGAPAAVGTAAGASAGASAGAKALQRSAEHDMFRLGSAEAHAEGYAAGHADGFAEGFAAGRGVDRA